MKIFHRARGPLCLVLTLLLLVQAGGLTVSAADPEDGLPPSVPAPAAYTGGEILVLYQDGSCETVACQDDAALAETLAQLSAHPDVALVQPNYTYESTALSTSDPLVGEQWALDNDGSFQLEEQENRYPVFDDPFDVPSAPWQWIAPWWMWSAGSIQVQAVPGIDIGLADAWRLYDGGSRDVVVALVDTGIDYTHEDLVGRIWTNTDEIPGNGIDDDGNGYVDDVYGWNFYSGTNDVYVGTEDAHGTHGAGTIAANAGNGVGIAGIVQSDHVKVMAVKALGGSDGSGTTASIIQAIQYAEANGAQICNLSLGSSQNDPALYRTIASSKMLFVVAAGNDGTDLETAPSYPASYDLDNLIAVANIRYDGELDSHLQLRRRLRGPGCPRQLHPQHHPRQHLQLYDRHLHGRAHGQRRGGHGLLRLSEGHPGGCEGHPPGLRPQAGLPHRPHRHRRDAGFGRRHGRCRHRLHRPGLGGAGFHRLHGQSACDLPVPLPVAGTAVSHRPGPGRRRGSAEGRLRLRDPHGGGLPGRQCRESHLPEHLGHRHLPGPHRRDLHLLRGGPGGQ